MIDLAAIVLSIVEALERGSIPYAIGGALALAYCGTPRATIDIDLNIFMPETESHAALKAVAEAGVAVQFERDVARIERDGQARLFCGPVSVDLFFSTVAFLDSAAKRIRRVPFVRRQIAILSCEDLAVCKIIFNRAKDWLDLADIVAMQGDRLGRNYIRLWLLDLLGDDDPRIARFDRLFD